MNRRSLGTIGATLAFALGLLLKASSAAGQVEQVPLPGNHPTGADFTVSAQASPEMTLNLTVNFVLRNREELEKLLAEQQDPTSPLYHQPLAPGEFHARFGAHQSDFQAVSDWLRGNGFSITRESFGEGVDYIDFSGSVALVEGVFHVTILMVGSAGAYANTDDPFIPKRFVGVISSISGLDNMSAFVPGIRKNIRQEPHSGGDRNQAHGQLVLAALIGTASETSEETSSVPLVITGGLGPAFAPSDLYTFYSETPLLKSGIDGRGADCIAVIETSDYLDSAVALFNSTFGLSSAAITRVFPDSSNPGIGDSEGEALVDIEWAHSAAPGAPISVYIGDPSKNGTTQAIVDALRQAATDNTCSVISLSFAACSSGTTLFTTTLDGIYKQAAANVQSVLVSSGDNGAAGLIFDSSTMSCVVGTSQNVNEASADPNVTSVGGTQFKPTYSSGNDQGFTPESAWQESFGATGGGASAVFSKPSWQTGVGVPNDGKRDVPDIAMMASKDMPGAFWAEDSAGTATIACCVGGTSLATPIWAGIVKLASQQNAGRLGNIDPQLYLVGSVGHEIGLRDVDLGNNAFNSVPGFPAKIGYDQATGWGTPSIAMFVNNFIAKKALIAGGCPDLWMSEPSRQERRAL